MAIDATSGALSLPSDQADDLTATNTIDPLANDQTWPTEEEMAEAPHEQASRSTKRVPKGTSAYQAAWIVDEDDEDEDDEDDDDDDMDEDRVEDDDGDSVPDLVPADDTEEVDVTTHDEGHDDLDPEEEEQE